jgi:hypothetical protein
MTMSARSRADECLRRISARLLPSDYHANRMRNTPSRGVAEGQSTPSLFVNQHDTDDDRKNAEKETKKAMTRRIRSLTITAAIAALIALTSAVSAKGAHTVTASQVEARTTLKDMQELAAESAKEAELLVMFSRNLSIDPAAHRISLAALKHDINAMGAEFAGLESRRDSLDATEQAAIDKVLPLLKEAVANVEDATRFYNENLGQLWSPAYRTFAEKAASDTEQIVKTIQNCRKYEAIHSEEQRIEGRLGLGENE